jgi:hypothetical protein
MELSGQLKQGCSFFVAAATGKAPDRYAHTGQTILSVVEWKGAV